MNMKKKIERFEDLEVWNLAMELSASVYEMTNDGKISKDFGLRDQIRRSSISVPSNIAEGFERDSHNQFIYFLNVAKASCGELRTQVKLANKLGYIENKKSEKLVNECIMVSSQLKGFINYLKSFKGKK